MSISSYRSLGRWMSKGGAYQAGCILQGAVQVRATRCDRKTFHHCRRLHSVSHKNAGLSQWARDTRLSSMPTSAQLHYANAFFESKGAKCLAREENFFNLPMSDVPEVVFLGRSNSGKSSLINAILESKQTPKELAPVGKKPGKTRTLTMFGIGNVHESRYREHDKIHTKYVGRDSLVLVDMPGYGYASQSGWGKQITKYITGRQQLRQIFVLINAQHGPKTTDIDLLRILRQNNLGYQLILTKTDKATQLPRKQDEAMIASEVESRMRRVFDDTLEKLELLTDDGKNVTEHDLIACSCIQGPHSEPERLFGIDQIRWAILCATGYETITTK